ncbi:MAG: GNAT family N-acetyltransferase [Alicyclobacillaceae bacterium]|nr:GNAT family N-acetyltransferase [Alicyclobacillaceae bacterium]
MEFSIRTMKPEDAYVIVKWHYSEPYSFYDMTDDEEDLREFLDFDHWKKDSKYAVYAGEDNLIGFFSFDEDNGIVDIGLGLRPDVTGNGLGLEFVQAGLDFARDKFCPKQFRLAVATFNERAIKVYKRMGFKSSETFMNNTNGGVYEFLEMISDSRPE